MSCFSFSAECYFAALAAADGPKDFPSERVELELDPRPPPEPLFPRGRLSPLPSSTYFNVMAI